MSSLVLWIVKEVLTLMATTNVYFLKLPAGDAKDYEDKVEAKNLDQAVSLFLSKTTLKFAGFTPDAIKPNITHVTKAKHILNILHEEWG